MTAPTTGSTALPALPRPSRWNRPLLGVTVAMAVLTLLTGVLALVDPREVLGQNAWLKPLKFALSTGIYALTMAWLVGLPGLRRPWLARAVALVTAIGLVIEIAVIGYAAAVGTTSHFNVSTPSSAALWSAMAVSIVVVWAMTLVVGVLVLRSPLPERARTLAVSAGIVLALAGMALGFLMTTPTPEQLEDFQGIAGAHAVGVPDGGAGIPFLGWSTQGGDLRVPHFVGLHALQAIPLVLLVLERASRRVAALRPERTRARLVLVAALGYAAVMALLTWQALQGQPVTAPGAAVLGGAAAIAGGVAAGAAAVLGRRPRGTTDAGRPRLPESTR
ncbi:hypothetical protein [Kineococcus sp. NUM-3379]